MSSEIEAAGWLSNFKDSPLSLLILCVTIVIMAAIIAIVLMHRKRPFLFDRSGADINAKLVDISTHVKRLDERIEADALARIKRQESIDKRFSDIDHRLKEVSITSGLAIVFSTHVPLWDKLMESLKYFDNDGNGNARDELIKAIYAQEGRVALFRSAVNEYIKKTGKDHSDLFFQSIEYIEKRLV